MLLTRGPNRPFRCLDVGTGLEGAQNNDAKQNFEGYFAASDAPFPIWKGLTGPLSKEPRPHKTIGLILLELLDSFYVSSSRRNTLVPENFVFWGLVWICLEALSLWVTFTWNSFCWTNDQLLFLPIYFCKTKQAHQPGICWSVLIWLENHFPCFILYICRKIEPVGTIPDARIIIF